MKGFQVPQRLLQTRRDQERPVDWQLAHVPTVLLVESARDDRAMYAEYLRLQAACRTLSAPEAMPP